MVQNEFVLMSHRSGKNETSNSKSAVKDTEGEFEVFSCGLDYEMVRCSLTRGLFLI